MIFTVRSRCRNRALDCKTGEQATFPLRTMPDFWAIGLHLKSFSTLSGFLFTHANRAASDANAAITGEQSRPVHVNPAGLKTSPRSICVTMAATVSRGGVTPKGVWLVASEPKDSKSYEVCLENTTVQSGSNSIMGLLSANESN